MKRCNFKGSSCNLDIWHDMFIMCEQDWDCCEKAKGCPLSICGSDNTTWQVLLWYRVDRSKRYCGGDTGTGLPCFPTEQQGQRIQRISWPQVKYLSATCNIYTGYAIAYVVSCQACHNRGLGSIRGPPCGISVGQIVTGTGFCLSTLIFPSVNWAVTNAISFWHLIASLSKTNKKATSVELRRITR